MLHNQSRPFGMGATEYEKLLNARREADMAHRQYELPLHRPELLPGLCDCADCERMKELH